MTTFEDRIARIAKKDGIPLIPASAGGVALAFSENAMKASEIAEKSRELRANLNAADRQIRFIALILGSVLGMIAGLMFQTFIGFETLYAYSFAEHVAMALADPAYLCSWLVILVGPVMFTILAAFPSSALRLTQFAGIYLGTSLGVNLAITVPLLIS